MPKIKPIEIKSLARSAFGWPALTPTEVVAAWSAGADVVKIFPCGALGGASYIKSLKAPLPQVEMIPTGGVSVKTAADFIRAG